MSILPARNQKTSTQRFTEIADIRDNIVTLTNGRSCVVIEVSSVNFALLSQEEQDTKVATYASLLNSLSFPIEIVIRSKAVEIKPYLDRLDEALSKTTNSLLVDSINQYKDFIENLVKLTTVLDKQFYIVISYSTLEGGVGSTFSTGNKNELFEQARTSLNTKTETLTPQIERLSLRTKVLDKEALVSFFHAIYNREIIAEPKRKGEEKI